MGRGRGRGARRLHCQTNYRQVISFSSEKKERGGREGREGRREGKEGKEGSLPYHQDR